MQGAREIHGERPRVHSGGRRGGGKEGLVEGVHIPSPAPIPSAQVALVGQEPVLFSGSVRDNIAYGLKSCSDEQVMAAARAAQADEFIKEMAHGLHTGTSVKAETSLFPGDGCVLVTVFAVPSPFPWLPMTPLPSPGALQGPPAGRTPLPPYPGPSSLCRWKYQGALVPAGVEGVVMVTCV